MLSPQNICHENICSLLILSSVLRISVVVELVKVVDPHAASEGHLFVVDIVRTRGARA